MFKVYHWDTFDDETILLTKKFELAEAVRFVERRYAGRISPSGADRVEIVDTAGNVVKRYSVG